MSDETNFEMAQLLRKSHCDKKEDNHECVGEMTVKRGEICLSCSLCGKGEYTPGWSAFIANKLDIIFSAAGFKWDSLTVEAKVAAIKAYQQVK